MALRNVSALQITWLACLVGVFPTSIGFTTWAYALSRMTAGRAGAMTYLIPPTAIVISWLLLAEVPPAVAILGGLLCIAGVVVARSSGIRVPAALRRRDEPA